MRVLSAVVVCLVLAACTKEVTETYQPKDFDQDGFNELVDCDDADGTAYPGADELCDEVDNDCDYVVDDDPVDGTTWYLDADEDGAGDPHEALVACTAPEGYVAAGTDCDDGDPAFYPGAVEDDCTDPNDYDCDGVVAWADVDRDGWAACEDCDDEDAAIHPGAVEVCDGDDNDCDEVTDGADALDAVPFYLDGDHDGYGLADEVVYACTAPKGYVADGTDCDDAVETTYPGAEEVCNAADDDCNGVEDDHPVEGTGYLVYQDLDADGVGDEAVSMRACNVPAGYSLALGDCDDLEDRAYPGALEVCDGVDNDCNDLVDDEADDAPTWYTDADGDGYGDATDSTVACEQPSGTVDNDDDCDDEHETAHPGRVEVCDELDNDCDDEVDEDDAVDAPTWYHDFDVDGFGDAGDSQQACDQPDSYVADDSDCADDDEDVYPGAPELCNETDDDCDGSADEEATDSDLWYLDADGDDQGGDYTLLACDPAPDGYVDTTGDCDDLDPAINSSADEVCDGVDNDCNDEVDDEAIDEATWYYDEDGDGVGVEGVTVESCDEVGDFVAVFGDCAPTNEFIYPGADELCDEVNQDCDDETDEDAVDGDTWYADLDGDGRGTTRYTTTACDAPTGFVGNAVDCNDGNPTVYPGADELCDGVDNDCLGDIDEDDAVDAPTWYEDWDGDGFGDVYVSVDACSAPTGYVADATDCDDVDPAIHPAALERCNFVNDDCDAETDEDDAVDAPIWYEDWDDDGYGDFYVSMPSCSQPSGYVANDTDCDDLDDEQYPGAAEVCNGADDDCDGGIDDGVLGETYTCPGDSCDDIITTRRDGPPDGEYWIDPVGGDPYLVHCNMWDADGGWTLLAVFTNNDGQSWSPYSSYWYDDSTFGTPTDPTLNADAKSRAFNDLPIDELMIQHWLEDPALVSSTSCIDYNPLQHVFQRNSENDADCAWSCPTVHLAAPWTGDPDGRQDSTLRFRCDDGESDENTGGYTHSWDDNSFITTLNNGSYSHNNFGLGAGENRGFADWDQTTEDNDDPGDTTQVLVYGR